MRSSASALPSCLGCQRYEVQLRHISSALLGLFKVWSFASTIPLCLYCQRSEVPLCILRLGQDFERSLSSSALVLPDLPNMGICPLPHFISAGTSKDVKLRFRTSALPWLAKIWSSAFRTSARSWLRKISFVFHTCSHVLPGLPSMGKSTSAFHLCRNFQNCEVAPSHFCTALTAKELKFRFPYFRLARTRKISFIFYTYSARTPKYGQVHFRISSLPGLSKSWNSASTFLLCLDCQRCEVLLPLFRRTFLLCIPTQMRTSSDRRVR